MIRSASVALLVLAADVPSHQVETVPLQASAVIAGKRFTFAGKGECQHSSAASIYNVPAAMWHAGFSGRADGIARANVTLWQLKSRGAIQISLALQAGGSRYDIMTVKGATLSGTGTGRVERQGTSGTIIVEGQTAGAARIQLSIACSRFTAPEDNG